MNRDVNKAKPIVDANDAPIVLTMFLYPKVCIT
jgi:hypothetical protein